MPEYTPQIKITVDSEDEFPPVSTLVHENLPELSARERAMSECADPKEWEQLASEYEAINMKASAARCRRRAQHAQDVIDGLRR